MFKLNDKEKKAKGSVLQEIIDMMSKQKGDSLKSLVKKPAVTEISVSSMKPEDDEVEESEEPLMTEASEDEPSEEEKAQIAALYEKFCK